MASTIPRTALIITFAVAMTAVGTGCDESCAFDFRCPVQVELPGPGGSGGAGGEGGGGGVGGCPADPADGPVAADCGVWVAASWGSDEKPGSQAEPVATLAQAITLAKAGKGQIYACGETFAEAVEVPSGVSIAGGFSCTGGSWVYEGEEKPAILAPARPGLVALTLLSGERESRFTDLEVASPDAVEPGASSIAIVAHEEANVTIQRARVISGNGADGADGEDGGHDGAPAPSGLSGNDGANACTADPGLGGMAVTLDCDGIATAGGSGGNGGEVIANDGASGLPLPGADPPSDGVGGEGESAVDGTMCTGGAHGKPGGNGIDGAGGKGRGTIGEYGYFGAAGEDGFPGTPGQGGGGGGGSLGGGVCGGAPHGGAGGGSGGTGGCGGKPGKGGQGGGSSIGILVLGPSVSLLDVTLVPGNGGKGGRGGASQLGGQGGFPGLGGLGFGGGIGVKPGCHGGAGGQGGNGGNGGGGRGGHSVGIALKEGIKLRFDDAIVLPVGVQGDGADGGNPSLTGSRGDDGIAADKLTFPK